MAGEQNLKMTFCVYLTHPEVQIDPAVPVPDWGLSQIGRDRAANARKLDWAAKIRRIIASEERKAVETAEIFAEPFDLPVETVAAFHENDRSATGFLPPPEFEATADQFFANPEQSIRGWERAKDAQTRIVRALKAVVLTTPDSDPILFSGHAVSVHF